MKLKNIHLSNVTIPKKGQPRIKGTNIPVSLIVGRSVQAVKKDYPHLTKKQIEDALVFAQYVIQSQNLANYAQYKGA